MDRTKTLAALTSELGPAVDALSAREWQHIVTSMELSAQQVRIVELILARKLDKQIAREMRVSLPRCAHT